MKFTYIPGRISVKNYPEENMGSGLMKRPLLSPISQDSNRMDGPRFNLHRVHVQRDRWRLTLVL